MIMSPSGGEVDQLPTRGASGGKEARPLNG